jgi:hypothetical protein
MGNGRRGQEYRGGVEDIYWIFVDVV